MRPTSKTERSFSLCVGIYALVMRIQPLQNIVSATRARQHDRVFEYTLMLHDVPISSKMPRGLES